MNNNNIIQHTNNHLTNSSNHGLSWWCISFLDMERYTFLFSTSFRKPRKELVHQMFSTGLWYGWDIIIGHGRMIESWCPIRAKIHLLFVYLSSGLLFLYHTDLPRIVLIWHAWMNRQASHHKKERVALCKSNFFSFDNTLLTYLSVHQWESNVPHLLIVASIKRKTYLITLKYWNQIELLSEYPRIGRECVPSFASYVWCLDMIW